MYTTGVASGGPSGQAFARVFARGTTGVPGRERCKSAIATVECKEQLVNKSRNRVAGKARNLKLEKTITNDFRSFARDIGRASMPEADNFVEVLNVFQNPVLSVSTFAHSHLIFENFITSPCWVLRHKIILDKAGFIIPEFMFMLDIFCHINP